jgi:intein-encoded DNA endonuclease-like protein
VGAFVESISRRPISILAARLNAEAQLKSSYVFPQKEKQRRKEVTKE